MIEQFKSYLIEVALKKYAPVAILAAFSWIGTYLAAHSGDLQTFGITYGIWPFTWGAGDIPSGPCILIELDTLSAYTIGLAVAAIAVIARGLQHHTTGATRIVGGKRAGDPPAQGESNDQP